MIKPPFKLYCVSHLPPLLGKDSYPGSKALLDHALWDLEAAVEGGATGLLLENEQDTPYTLRATPEGIACLTKLGLELKKRAPANFQLGVEFLIHDPMASLSVAKVCGLSFIRTDYFVDRMARAEYGGEIEVNPKEIVNYRDGIEAKDVAIFADIQVKYATLLEQNKPLSLSAEQAWAHGAQAAVMSATKTGEAPAVNEVKEVFEKGVKGDLFIGSGLSSENVKEFIPYISGAIVGTSLMKERKLQKEKISELLKNL
jgi:hypothetical protein